MFKGYSLELLHLFMKFADCGPLNLATAVISYVKFDFEVDDTPILCTEPDSFHKQQYYLAK